MHVYRHRSATLALTLGIGNGTADVTPQIRALERMAAVDSDKRRPPIVAFSMGTGFLFKGVVKDLSIRTPIVAPDGTRLSAIGDVTLLAADRAGSPEEFPR